MVVEVAFIDEDDGEGQDRAQMEDMITTFWNELGVQGGARRFKEGKRGEEEDELENVRLWCRVLILKG